jgi:hypothetical protein
MITTTDNVRAVKRVTRVRPGVGAVIAEVVLARLGEPDDLLKVQVKRVLGRKYRVNVYVRAAGSCRIAHSYFVEADGRGAVLASSPPITRAY